jgi:hypothetical protein
MAPLLPEPVTWRKKLGIHEGARIDRLFEDVLGTPNLIDQSLALRDIADDVFDRPTRGPQWMGSR